MKLEFCEISYFKANWNWSIRFVLKGLNISLSSLAEVSLDADLGGSGRFWLTWAQVTSGPEDVHGSDDVLAADGTLVHPLPTLGARDHVTALQQDAVDGGVHADLTEVLLQTRTLAAAGV